RRSREMVDLPAPKVGTTDVPPFALSVRLEDESALPRANQYPQSAHRSLLVSRAPPPAPDPTVWSNGGLEIRHTRRSIFAGSDGARRGVRRRPRPSRERARRELRGVRWPSALLHRNRADVVHLAEVD